MLCDNAYFMIAELYDGGQQHPPHHPNVPPTLEIAPESAATAAMHTTGKWIKLGAYG
jgi:hypothetical protein